MPRTGAFFWSCLPAGLEDFCCASGPAAATCPPQPRLDRPADRCPAVPRRATGSRRSHGSNRRLACRPFGRCVHALPPLQVTKRARWACSVADSCRCGLDVARVWGPPAAPIRLQRRGCPGYPLRRRRSPSPERVVAAHMRSADGRNEPARGASGHLAAAPTQTAIRQKRNKISSVDVMSKFCVIKSAR